MTRERFDTPANASRSVRGFALPVVLFTLAMIGAIGVGVIPKGTAGIVEAAAIERRARERYLIEAGLARGVLALVDLEDPMTEALHKGQPVPWTFASRELTITVRSENAKLDLNAADPGALAAALTRALGPELGADALTSALAQRGRLTSPDQVLPLAKRFSQSAARIRDIVTVYGGQLEEGSIDSTGGLPAVAVSGRPIYTVRAGLAGRARARALTVLVEPEAHRYAVLDHVDLDTDDAGPDQ